VEAKMALLAFAYALRLFPSGIRHLESGINERPMTVDE
jgi:hypothetical protein